MSFQDYLAYRKDAVKKKISEHYSIFDVVNSATAIVKKIDNRPTVQNITNATALAKNVLEKIPFPFRINCWLRNEALNKAVGGVMPNPKKKTLGSQHIYGQAIDITPTKDAIELVYQWIKKNLIYDQLIHEGTWIHVSFSLVKNRRQSLRLVSGKYIAG